jgi:phosphatidate cytidylyltransferase
MSYRDPPDRRDRRDQGYDGASDPYPRHRARHTDAAPDAYSERDAYPDDRYRYGDGVSAYPLYADPVAATDPRPAPGPMAAPGPFVSPGTPVSGGGPRVGGPPPVSGGPAGSARGPVAHPVPEADPTHPRRRHDRRAAPPVPVSPPPPPPGRAGRNLPAAIGVGLGLGALVLASLLLWRPAFLAVVVAAIGVATWEMARAVAPSGARPPLVPLVAGGTAMAGLAWWGGAETLTLGLVATAVAALVWRLADGPARYLRDITASLLIAVYVPFLGGFAVLLVRPDDGALRVIATLAGVVLSDTGGYVAGVLFGRRPMAPSVSPKKSWEGLVGSLVASAVGGAFVLYYLLDVAWWWGALFGLAVSAAAVLGDLAESLIKRDLGIKDMSTLLPGHGGLMDRLDSILFALPTAYAVLTLVAPVSG